jgi:radical SAM superfamily enzyme
MEIISEITISAPFAEETDDYYGQKKNKWRRHKPKRLLGMSHGISCPNHIGHVYDRGCTKRHALSRADAVVHRLQDWRKACMETSQAVEFVGGYDEQTNKWIERAIINQSLENNEVRL